MQRNYQCQWTPEEYAATEGHRQVLPETSCPCCLEAVVLHRHGAYQRSVATVLGKLLRLWIARFLCPLCGRSISYLPDFAFAYRLLQPATLQAAMEGKSQRADVRTFRDLLQCYQRRLIAFAGELIRTVGAGFGLPPPADAAGVWPWLKSAGDGLHSVTRQLVTTFKIGLFNRYRCHQPTGP